MKRLAAVLLAAVLVLGLTGVPVLALDTDIYMDNGAIVMDDKYTDSDFLYVLGVDANTIEIPIFWDGFDDLATGNDALISDMTAQLFNRMTLEFSDSATRNLFTISVRIYQPGASTLLDPAFILTPHNIGPATGTITLVYQNPTSTPYGATTRSDPIPINGEILDPTINKKITELSGIALDDSTNGLIKLNGDVIDADQLEALDEIPPGSELTFRLNTEFFEWEPEIPKGTRASVRKSTLDNNLVGVSRRIVAGNSLIEDVVIENIDGIAHVVVRFIDDFVSVKEQKFELFIHLTLHNTKYENTGVHIFGSLANDTVDWGEDFDYVYIGDGSVVKADAYARNAKLDLGNGVFIYTTLMPGTDYYGKAVDERTEGDNAIMDYFPSIKSALSLSTVNIPTTRCSVEFDTEFLHFVYDQDGDLLGTTDEMLPYREKYYLSIEEIYFSPLNAPALLGEDEEEQTNDHDTNDNPNTGSVSRTLFAGLSALGLLGASISMNWDKRKQR